MSRKRKKWLSRMLALCLILALLPINTAYADEVDTQDAVYQTEDIQPAEAAAQPEEVKPEVQPEVQSEETQPETQPEEQPEEVKPETQPEEAQPEETQPEEVKPEAQPEEVKPEEQPEVKPEEVQPEEVKPEEVQPEEVKPEAQPAEAQPEEVQPEAPVQPDQDAAVEEAVEPAEIMLAPAAVSPTASPEIIKEIELNLKPVTEITKINDFRSIAYSPSDKIHLEEVTVYEGYNNTNGSTPSVYTPNKGYTVIYEFRCDKNAYKLNSYCKVKINSEYIKNWDWECKFFWGYALKVYVYYPSLKNTVGVTFRPRNQ